jgi:hypothetical protein
MGIGATDRMTCRRSIPLLALRISRREDAVIYRAGFSNQAGTLALGLWDKSNHFTHIRSNHQLEDTASFLNDDDHSILMWDINLNLEALRAVTKE